MAKIARDEDGLTPQEAATAAAHARGLNQSDSYRAGFGGRGKPETIHSKASTLFRKPQVRERVRALLRASNIQDITSQPEHMRTMMTARETAFEAGNYTAAASWDKTIAQSLSMTSNNLNVNFERTLSDEQVVSRQLDIYKEAGIATTEAELKKIEAVLRAHLGMDHSFE